MQTSSFLNHTLCTENEQLAFDGPKDRSRRSLPLWKDRKRRAQDLEMMLPALGSYYEVVRVPATTPSLCHGP